MSDQIVSTKDLKTLTMWATILGITTAAIQIYRFAKLRKEEKALKEMRKRQQRKLREIEVNLKGIMGDNYVEIDPLENQEQNS